MGVRFRVEQVSFFVLVCFPWTVLMGVRFRVEYVSFFVFVFVPLGQRSFFRGMLMGDER